jgi:hypothetical protein
MNEVDPSPGRPSKNDGDVHLGGNAGLCEAERQLSYQPDAQARAVSWAIPRLRTLCKCEKSVSGIKEGSVLCGPKVQPAIARGTSPWNTSRDTIQAPTGRSESARLGAWNIKVAHDSRADGPGYCRLGLWPTRGFAQRRIGWPRQLVVWVPKGQEGLLGCTDSYKCLLLLRNTDNKLSVPPQKATAASYTRLLRVGSVSWPNEGRAFTFEPRRSPCRRVAWAGPRRGHWP